MSGRKTSGTATSASRKAPPPSLHASSTKRSGQARFKGTSRRKGDDVPAPPSKPPKLVPQEDMQQRAYKPSEYIATMALTSEEYLAQTSTMAPPTMLELNSSSGAIDTAVDIDRPLFQPFPSTVRFQNYESGATYILPIKFTNIDKTGRRLKILPSDSPYFEVIHPTNVGSKIAPGMDAVFRIKFTPDASKDYAEQLTCITERETFVVPIRAVGARALFDLPDDISFGQCTVKSTSKKSILLRNIGDAAGRFQFQSEGPFAISPTSGTVGPQEHVQIQATFSPQTEQTHVNKLKLFLSTGETLVSDISGTAEPTAIRLDTRSLRFEETYISRRTQKVVAVRNPAKVPAKFSWKRFESADDEAMARAEVMNTLSASHIDETNEFLQMLQEDPTISHGISILNRDFRRQKTEIETDLQDFANDDSFSIEPVSGEIWVGETQEFVVTFHPEVAGPDMRSAFLDITGQEKRLELVMRGTGLGPKVEFDVDSLDVGKVFIGSKRKGTLTLSNMGDIEAPFAIECTEESTSASFSFTPEHRVVKIGESITIDVDISADMLGAVDTLFACNVDGSIELVTLRVLGEVVGPSYECDVDTLDFGEVPFGFPSTQYITLTNTSSIDMTFSLTLPDGSPAASEIEIDPPTETIPPHGAKKIAVDITPMWCESYDLHLSVIVQDSEDDALVIPIIATCVVPQITLETHSLDYQRCFLGHAYTATVKFHNPSALQAKYSFLSQGQPLDTITRVGSGIDGDKSIAPLDEAAPSISLQCSANAGIIAPSTTTEITMALTAHTLGEHTATAKFEILGSPDPPLEVRVHCFGQGAVVASNKASMDWGSVRVLADHDQVVTLSNESIIETEYSCLFEANDSLFTCNPTTGVLKPGESVDVTVRLNTNVAGKIANTLIVRVPNSRDQLIDLTATGKGATLVFSEDIACVDFGLQTIGSKCERSYTITNLGNVAQKVHFKLDSPPPGPDGHCRVMRGSTFKPKKTPACPKPPKPSYSVFGISPENLALKPNESAKVTLKGKCSRLENIDETLLCMACAASTVKQKLAHKVHITANCIEPAITAYPVTLNYHWSYGQPSGVQIQPVTLTNPSNLEIPIKVLVDEPFMIAGLAPGDEFAGVVPASGTVQIEVAYDPLCISNRFSRVDKASLYMQAANDSSKVALVALEAVVDYPNIVFSHEEEIDCGSILKDTSSVLAVTMTNEGPLPSEFVWELLGDTVVDENINPNEGSGPKPHEEALGTSDEQQNSPSSEKVQGGVSPSLEASQGGVELEAMSAKPLVFDIFPFSGTVPPGETVTVYVTFFAAAEGLCEVAANCRVTNGPTYSFDLKGITTSEDYSLNTEEIVFDNVSLAKVDKTARTLLIQNENSLPLSFAVISTPENFTVSPASGEIPANDFADLTLLLLTPQLIEFEEDLVLQIGTLAPRSVTVRGITALPHLGCVLPRDLTSVSATLLAKCDELVPPLSTPSSPSPLLAKGQDLLLFKERSTQGNGKSANGKGNEEVDEENGEGEEEDPAKLAMMKWGEVLDKEIVNAALDADQSLVASKIQIPPYVCDLGAVIRGNVAASQVLIHNPSPFDVSFELPKRTANALASNGIDISPQAVKGLPSGESVPLTVTLSTHGTNRFAYDLGPVDQLADFSVASGIRFPLKVVAEVCTPTFTFSREKLQFGGVRVGMCRQIKVRLANDQPVPCEWSAIQKLPAISSQWSKKKQADAMKHREMVAAFNVSPATGTIEANSSAVVTITFTPTEGKSYRLKLPFHVLNSKENTSPTLALSGLGKEADLEFATSSVEFASVAPREWSKEEVIKVTNNTDEPVEVYSVEYDSEHKRELDALRLLPAFTSTDTILLPPQRPGHQLPKEIMAYALAHTQADRMSFPDVDESPEDAGDAFLPEKTDAVGSLKLEDPVPGILEAYLGGEMYQCVKNNDFGGVNAVLHGPLASGKTTLAKRIAEHYQATVLDLDTVIFDAYNDYQSSVAGAQIREFVCQKVEEERAQLSQQISQQASRRASAHRTKQAGPNSGDDKDSTTSRSRRGSASTQNNSASNNNSNSSAKVAADARMHQRSASPSLQQNGTSPQPLSMSSGDGASKKQEAVVNTSVDEDDLKESVDESLLSDGTPAAIELRDHVMRLPAEMVALACKERIAKADTAKGVIIDGLVSEFASQEGALMAWLEALSARKHVLFINLKTSRSVCVQRLVDAEQVRLDEIQRPPSPPKEMAPPADLDEDEYDALTAEEQADYDAYCRSYRLEQQRIRREKLEEEARLKELQEKQKRGKKGGKKSQMGGTGVLNAQQPQQADEDEALDDQHRPTSPSVFEEEVERSIASDPLLQKIIYAWDCALSSVIGGDVAMLAAINVASHGSALGSSQKGGEAHAQKKSAKREKGAKQSSLEKPTGKDALAASHHGSMDATAAVDEERDDIFGQLKPNPEASKPVVCIGLVNASANADAALHSLIATEAMPKFDELTFVRLEATAAQDTFHDPVDFQIVSRPDRSNTPEIGAGDDDAGDEETAAIRGNGRQSGIKGRKSTRASVRAGAKRQEGVGHTSTSLRSAMSLSSTQKRVRASAAEESVGSTTNSPLKGVSRTGTTSLEEDPFFDEDADETVALNASVGSEASNALAKAVASLVTDAEADAMVVGAEVEQQLQRHIEEGNLGPLFVLEFVDKLKELEKTRRAAERAESLRLQQIEEETELPPSRRGGRKTKDGSSKSRPGTSQKVASKSARRKKTGDVSSERVATAGGGGEDPSGDHDGASAASEMASPRWVIPANSSTLIHVRFRSRAPGQFDEALNFKETIGGKVFTVFCRGTSTFPHFDERPREVFGSRIARTVPDVFPSQLYIYNENTIDFGPLLLQQVKRITDNELAHALESSKFPLALHNPSESQEITVRASLMDGGPTSIFRTQPQQLTIRPGGTEVLTVYAFPKQVMEYSDTLVLCTDGNPTVKAYRVRAHGVRPLLEFSKKSIAFERVLLELTDTKVITLTNPTDIPVAFQWYGFDALPEVSSDMTSGIIDPGSSTDVSFFFSSQKPASLSKKSLHIEYTDIDNIYDTTTEHLTVSGEAYDVMFDMVFPKQGETLLDYEIVRVGEEKSITCSIKNRGKYEFEYRLVVDQEALASVSKHLSASAFTITPSTASLSANDKSTTIKCTFSSPRALTLIRAPVLRCQVIEPHMGQTIVDMPIHVSARCVYSKYAITPASGIKFGAVQAGPANKVVREFTIRNTGEHDFRFTIRKLGARGPSITPRPPPTAGGRGRRTSVHDSVTTTGKFSIGVFTVYPTSGSLPPGQQAVISVEADTSLPCKELEALDVDIENRMKKDNPDGIRYELSVEACVPAINQSPSALFEAHSLTQRFDPSQPSLPSMTFSVNENLFSYGAIVVNSMAHARIKIVNTTKVPATVSLMVHKEGQASSPIHPVSKILGTGTSTRKTASSHNMDLAASARKSIMSSQSSAAIHDGSMRDSKGARNSSVGVLGNASNASSDDVFSQPASTAVLFGDLGIMADAPTVTIPSHDFKVVTLTYMPKAIEQLHAVCDITVEGGAPNARKLTFDLSGEGVLPRVSIAKPTTRTADRLPLVKFPRTLVNKPRVVPLVVRNEGPVTAMVSLCVDQAGTGSASGVGSTAAQSRSGTSTGTRPVSSRGKRDKSARKKLARGKSGGKRGSEIEDTVVRPPQPAVATDGPFTCLEGVDKYPIAPHGTFTFNMQFLPEATDVFSSTFKLSVENNEFEAAFINLSGEGFMHDLAIEGLDDDDNGLLLFGDTLLGVPATRTLTLTNCCSDVLRFEWPTDGNALLQFAPAIAHLAPGQSIRVTASFCEKSGKPATLDASEVALQLRKITLNEPDIHEPTALADPVAESSDNADVSKPMSSSSSSASRAGDGWNSSKIVVSYDVEKNERGRLVKVKKETPVAEPAYTLVPDSESHVVLKCSGVTDHASVACDASEVAFGDLLMYRESSKTFTLSNTGNVSAEFMFELEDDLMVERSTPLPFTVNPTAGTIPVGSAISVEVLFAPATVEKFDASLHCRVLGLAEKEGKKTLAVESSLGNATADAASEVQVMRELVEIDVTGTSLLPVCHFAIADSDYVASGRRNPELPGPNGETPELAPDMRVFEVASCGIRVINTLAFDVINPQPDDYAFEWRCLSRGAMPNPSKGTIECGPFRCATPKGAISAGESAKMVFQYVPHTLDLVETFWELCIPSKATKVTVLLVGHAEEPSVALNCTHLDFQSLRVGQKATQDLELVNNEKRPFDFAFDAKQLESLASGAKIKITPLHGRVPARSAQPITVSFSPRLEQPFDFHLTCNVKRKPTPLILRLTSVGYRIHSGLELLPIPHLGTEVISLFPSVSPPSTAPTGAVRRHKSSAPLRATQQQPRTSRHVRSSRAVGSKRGRLDSTLPSAAVHQEGLHSSIDFGDVHLNEVRTRVVHVVNEGSHPFHFSFTKNKNLEALIASSTGTFSIDPQEGTVMNGARVPVELSYRPVSADSLHGCQLTCAVSEGPRYVLDLLGGGTLPQLEVKPAVVKFGKIFLHKPGMPVASKTVTFTNRDADNIVLTSSFVSSDTVQVDFEDCVLAPNETLEVPIRVTPSVQGAIDCSIEFEINSLVKTVVRVAAAGVPVRLQLEAMPTKELDMGAVQIGEVVSKTAVLHNRSALPLAVTLLANEQGLRASSLQLHPLEETVIAPNSSMSIKAKFSPKSRIPLFQEEISIQYLRQLESLMFVTGSCQGVTVELNHNQLTFNAVVNSTSSRRVTMSNTGDIGAKFHWDTAKFGEWFSISPSEGFLSPGSDTTFVVSFHPKAFESEVRVDGVCCTVEGLKRPLALDLVGNVQRQQAEREVLSFQATVRTEETSNIKISNDSNSTWTLSPVIDNDFFKGPGTIVIGPGETKAYPVTYFPLTMTDPVLPGKGSSSTTGASAKKGQNASQPPSNVYHQGSIFFSLPDGKALLYKLMGQSFPPKPLDVISRDVPCKVQYKLPLSVTNWLAKHQRFKVTIKRSKAEASTIIKGHEYLDVLPNATKEYEIHFFAYKEGNTVFEVMFKNETSSEYMYYECHFKSTAISSIETISLTTTVRQPITHTITLHNPLSTPVAFNMASIVEGTNKSSLDIQGPNTFRVPPNATSAKYSFDFLPLIAGEKSVRLMLSCTELGVFQYDLRLKATEAGPMPTERFSCMLGGQVVRKYFFLNHCPIRTDYQVTVEGGAHFSCPTSMQASAAARNGTRVPIEIVYEPFQLGDCKATMTITSAVGGTYVVPLFGQCHPPKPSGPFVMKAASGGKVGVPFKNVFRGAETYQYTVDNPAFSVKTHELYKTMETKEITVRYDGLPGSVCMGKLTVSHASGVSWIFYLKSTA